LLHSAGTLAASVVAYVTRAHPFWNVEQGICPNCALQFSQQLTAARHSDSLHSSTEPHTTFPYYHPLEETVRSQPERLPDYARFDANPLTIAFLDSGYYPHPDLQRQAAPDNSNENQSYFVTPYSVTAGREPHPGRADEIRARWRLIDYVDLTGGHERVGLEQPSLWSGAGDSWHGQMTSVIAAGNGQLSGGRYRGLAPAAQILPVKIGRGDGRIPEEDILAGLQWLLKEDRWCKYNVRVLNISVGGDYPMPWQDNPVCQAAEELVKRGVFIAAAAGNRGRNELLPPAQAPSVMTVGGADDHNLLTSWQVALYPHNFGEIQINGATQHKPDILALARYLPGPVLPVSHVFTETQIIAGLRSALGWPNSDMVPAQTNVLPHAPRSPRMAEVERAVRYAMNAHKWIHRYYQHVEGTSVAAAQVSAVAAQVIHANPQLTPLQVQGLLRVTALPLPQHPTTLTGSGLIQPAQAVAEALRTAGGPLLGIPLSGVRLSDAELQKLQNTGRVDGLEPFRFTNNQPVIYYVGCYAPNAQAVSLIGDFNRWTPEATPLVPLDMGWWQALLFLPPGEHRYRFWVATGADGEGYWQSDAENPLRCESGYAQVENMFHSVLR
jgi:serine protease AprX